MMKNVLVTGSNSYIGTSFSKWISNKNKQVECTEISVRGENWKNKDFSIFTSILHVAGIAHVNSKAFNDKDYYLINTNLTIEVAKKAKRDGVPHFIFMSSIIVFNDSSSQDGRIGPDTIPNTNNPYGNSKLMAEQGIKNLEDETFKVSIIRPPMIYGTGSKGNYPRLARIARISPVFPDYPNKRSMLYIENLCQIIYEIVQKEVSGVFHPQNKEYVNTTVLVQEIAKVHRNRLMTTKLFNPLIKLFIKTKIVSKVFGNLYYEGFESCGNMDVDFISSVKRTELS